jgi:DNA-binding transcriptional LysR family regulator
MAIGRAMAAADLHGHTLVVREAPTSWVFQDGQTELTIQPRGKAIIPDAAAQKIVLEGGAGIGFLPSYLAAPSLTAGTLVPVLSSLRREPIELHALYPIHRSMATRSKTPMCCPNTQRVRFTPGSTSDGSNPA